jgi:hypothetical protein
MTPTRIQRKRTKGYRSPPSTVYVGRPSRWANPYKVCKAWSAEAAVAKFFLYALGRLRRDPHWLDPLRKAKYLACWCPLVDSDGNHVPCHADVLIELLKETP